MPTSWAASTSPPVAATPFNRWRRLTLLIVILLCVLSSVMSRPLSSGANGRVDALIAAAATEVSGHAGGDLLVGRRRFFRQQRRCLHDLAGLTVPALGHTDLAPGNLDGMLVLGMQAFNGGDGLAGGFRHLHHARTLGRAVDMHRACAAQADAATKLGPGYGQLVAQVPQKRHRRISI